MKNIINKNVKFDEESSFSYMNDSNKRIFPGKLNEQIDALKNDSLLAEYKECRKKTADDRYRPVYHYTAPYELLNDPNGLCFWNGMWHLFYQHIVPIEENGVVNSWGTIYWSHIVSKDLVHWVDLPRAIYPNPEKQCWSGAVCQEEDKVTAMYYGFGNRDGLYCAQSSDPLLLNWKKCYNGPVIPSRSRDDSDLPYRVYDPCIWKKDGVYYALSGTQTPHPGTGYSNRTFYLFRSENTVDWEYLHPFVPLDTYTEVYDDGACPYFLPLDDKYLLIHFSHARAARYLIGDYDKENDMFYPCSGGRFNQFRFCGAQAPSATPSPNGDGSAYLIFNTHVGSMTLPYHITLAKDKDLIQVSPAEGLKTLRNNETHRHIDNINMPANQEVVLNDVQGNTIELIAEFDIPDSGILEMKVLRSPDLSEYTKISVYRYRGSWGRFTEQKPYSVVSLDCSHSQLSLHSEDRLLVPSAPDSEEFRLYPDEKIKLHIFIDRSHLDIFCNDRVCINKIVFPVREDSIGFSVTSCATDGKMLSLDAWNLNSIDSTDLSLL